RLSINRPNLGLYGLFFLLAAIGLLPIVFFADNAMDAVFSAIDDPRYGSLLASTLLFFIPTALLGMIAPYSVRLMVDNTRHSGQVAGGLYFVSTLGSALGTLLTSFYLVLWFDMNTILITMVGVLLLAGSLAIAFNRRRS
ncbi:MAG: fused MFS/spermidine synthase, partial [Gammaproteobacteria bacterium]|nr:fused MFS/spermidine synthase [Gammaproteobacteria bacterium]